MEWKGVALSLRELKLLVLSINRSPCGIALVAALQNKKNGGSLKKKIEKKCRP